MKVNFQVSSPALCFSLLAIFISCQNLYAEEDGLVGRWTFDKPANAAEDSSGKNNTGKAGAETECAKGQSGSAILLNGDSSHVVEIPDSESLHFGNSDFSIECWICPHTLNIDAPDKRRRLLSKNGAPTAWWVLDIRDSGKILLEMADENRKGAAVFSDGSVSVNRWTHLAVIVDRKSKKSSFFIDGKLDSVKTLSPDFNGKLDVAGKPLRIGGDWQFFIGLLDELKLYNRVLTNEEIRNEYDKEKELRTSVKYEKKACLSAEFATKPCYAVFNPHEPVAIIVKVTGDRLKEDRIVWRVKDFRENVIDKGTLAIPGGSEDFETIIRLKEYPAGYFEIHMKMESHNISIPRQGSLPPGFLAFAVLPEIETIVLKHPDDSRFGIQGTSNVSADGDPFAPLYDIIGVKWFYDNTGAPWLTLPAWVEKTGPNIFKPVLDPKVHQQEKKFQMKNRLSALFDLHSVPPWLMKMPEGKAPPAPDKVVPAHNCQDYPPKDWEYYADLLKRMISEKTVLRAACYPYMRRSYYQIHWEIDWYWKGNDEDFIRLYEVASKTIKDNDSGAFLLGPNYGVLSKGNKDLERLFAKGLGKYLDGILMHSYFLAPNGENGTSPEEGGVVKDARKLMRMVRQYLPPGVPVMNTEGSSRINGINPETSPWILRRQAAWFLRNHLICLGEGFTSTWFFLLSDNNVYGGYGLFYNLSLPQSPYHSPRLAPKPVFSATAAATRLLEGTKTICPLEYISENVLGYCFERKDQLLVALWSADDKEREIVLPVGTAKVSLYDPMGNRSELKSADGIARVKIDGNPVYLLGVAREALPITESDLAGYPGNSFTFQKWSAIPDAKYYLFRDGSRLPVEQVKGAPVIPAVAQPGIWLLQCVVSEELRGSWLATVNPPVDIQPSCPIIMDRFIDLNMENKTDAELSGHLRLSGRDIDKDAGAATFKAGEKRKMHIDLNDLNIASPTRRIITAEFKDQNGIVSKSPGMPCSMTTTLKASSAPVIDGDLSDWAKVPFHQIRGEDAVVIKNPEAPLLGDDDLSFCVASQYDDKALYLAIKVRDQSHVQTRPGGDSWQEDSVQIGIAADWDGTKWNVWQKLCIALGKDGKVMVSRNNGTHLPGADIHETSLPCSINRTNGETCYELAIPWRVVDPRLTGVPPQKRLGVGILVNDVDAPSTAPRKKDAAGSQQAETEVMLSTVSSTPKRKAMEAYGGMFWGKPEEFGVLLLIE
ncbi:MAG: LamG-like jellyroll fold domain-containing protein [Victivallales bacterium]